MSRLDILKYKQAKINIHDAIYRDVPFKRECEWTVVDNLSGDYYEHETDTKQDSYIGKYTKISDMVKKDNSQRVNKDISDFNNWKQAIKQVKQRAQQEQSSKKESFPQRSQTEIEIAQQIKQKNQIIKQQKEQQRQKDKQKVKILTPSSSNGTGTSSRGYVNVVVLSLVVSFVCGALFMIVYMLLER